MTKLTGLKIYMPNELKTKIFEVITETFFFSMLRNCYENSDLTTKKCSLQETILRRVWKVTIIRISEELYRTCLISMKLTLRTKIFR